MKLFDILCNTRYKLAQGGNTEITKLTIDSRSVERGSMFFCIKGLKSDGHMFVPDAVAAGAAAIVAEEEIAAPEAIAVVIVDDAREALAYAAANFYDRPAEELTLIGVTGTNGKTSTTYFVEAMAAACGKKTGVIGTLNFRIGAQQLEIHTATSTTPDTIELQQILQRMREEQVEYAVMEVTSHAIALRKTDGLHYKVGVFTNLTQDHLDFHGTMENYRDTKARFFGVCENSVINADDPYAAAMIRAAAGKVLTYSIDSDSDLKAEDVRLMESGCAFTVEIDGVREDFFIPVRGRFSVYNSLGAIGAGLCMGLPVSEIRTALRGISGVPGRIQSVRNDCGFDVVVDYSHTPDSLHNIILAMREATKGRIITVFGCGGDRDRTKRPIMGRIAGEGSDFCVVTSDNPRTEDPEAILDEIEPGIKATGCAYEKICDRRRAIERAVEFARPGDSVIIAGKGHENYQIFADRTVHFDDYEVAEEALRKVSPVAMTVREIAEAVAGAFAGDPDIVVRGVSTNTRAMTRGSLFIALKGENFNGHDYIGKAFALGAAACIAEASEALGGAPTYTGGTVIQVDSSARALRDLAEHHRRKFPVPVIAITGSAGKTSTKDMTALVLSQKYGVLKTECNQNNEIGLPLTVLRLTREHECAVLELGMNHFGEIHRLSKTARPNLCVVTNIGMAHVENLGDQAGVLRAKTEIFDYMDPDGTVILNGDDALLRGLVHTPGTRLYYGFGPRNDLFADQIRENGLESISATVHYEGMSFGITVPRPGVHMLHNALAAVAVGLKLGLSVSQIQKGLSSFVPSENRMDVFQSPWGFTVVNDSYNANPAAMTAALDLLARRDGVKACILGDMRELGEKAEELHAELGRYVAGLGIDRVIFIGPLCYAAYRAARGPNVFHFYDKQRLLAHLRETLEGTATVLVKGSRAMKLEEVVDWFRKREE